jgi:hypothetical protein
MEVPGTPAGAIRAVVWSPPISIRVPLARDDDHGPALAIFGRLPRRAGSRPGKRAGRRGKGTGGLKLGGKTTETDTKSGNKRANRIPGP